MIQLLISLVFAAPATSPVDALSPTISKQVMNLNVYLKNVAKDQVLETKDTQDQGKPDTFIVFKVVDNNKILQMHLFDLNRDQKVDVVKHFKDGKMIKTESILDKDGKVFAITEFDPETGYETTKTLFDNQLLTKKISYKNELRREEMDRNLDGKVDMWVHFRNGKVLKTEVDEDYDGKNIKVIAGEYVDLKDSKKDSKKE
jgi:antitoxin component YwqK of YwqJK toxin-antitoxin module